MSSISNVEQGYQANQAQESSKSNSNSRVSGKTIGKPQLSEAGAKYYEQLKNKYKDMDFILVSRDQKENAKANAAAYANPAKTVVLIDEDKIERMATDENYRKQYEGVISNAKSQLSAMKEQMANHAGVKGFGIEVNDDGTTTLFAVLKDSSKKQAERIAKKAAEKKAQKREADKKADKKAAEELLEKRRSQNGEKDDRLEAKDTADNATSFDRQNLKESYKVLRASNIEDLMRQIEDYEMSSLSDSVRTKEEQYLGQNIDFSL